MRGTIVQQLLSLTAFATHHATTPHTALHTALNTNVFTQFTHQVQHMLPQAATVALQTRFASKKQGGSTQNHRGQNPKNLGFKMAGGQIANPGNILVRQRGRTWHPGNWVGIGRDYTLYALRRGKIKTYRCPFRKRKWVYLELCEEGGAKVGVANEKGDVPSEEGGHAVQATS